jgi:Flp pilus assembly protein TadD
VQAAQAGQWDLAAESLERVTRQGADRPATWNNLAWVLMQRERANRTTPLVGEEPQPDEAELQRAMAAVERALAISPDEYRFRETRGQILLQLGQWQSAIEDLEYALNGMPQNAGVHAGLATAYRQVGETELSQMHAELSETP